MEQGHSRHETITKSLDRRYLSVLVLLAILSIGSFSVVESLLAHQNTSAREMNTAGRQRMLSQRFGYLATQTDWTKAGVERTRVLEEMQLVYRNMRLAHKQLTIGDSRAGIKAPGSDGLMRLYFGPDRYVDRDVKLFLADARTFLKDLKSGKYDKSLPEYFPLDRISTLLADLDAVVGQYQLDSEERISTLQSLQWVIVTGTLLILLLSGLLIFRPLVKRIDRKVSQLASAEARLSAFFENMPAPINIKSEDGRFTMVNREFLRIHSLNNSDVIGKSGSEVFSTENAERFAALDASVLKGDRMSVDEVDIHLQDGSVRRVQSIKFIMMENGQRFIGTISPDITDIRMAQKAAQESEEKFRKLVEGSVQGVFIHRNSQLIFANRSAATMFGYAEPEEMLKLNSVDELVFPEERDRLRRLRQKRENIEIISAQHRARYLKKDGETIWLDTVNEIVDWEGQKAIQSTAIDITGLKRAEESIQQTQKMDAVGQLASGLAHDFNNLLGIIGGNLDLLKRKSTLDDRSLSKVETAAKAVSRGAELTKQLLDFTRRESDGIRVTDVNDVISGVEALIRQSVSKMIDVVFTPGADITPIRIDKGDLEDVMVNLATNARDAMPQGGQLTIETSHVVLSGPAIGSDKEIPSGDYVLVSVSDNGDGIPPATLDKIFEPFFTTKDKGKGTGLGLAMVYGFVARSNGHIRVYSEEGIGTSFRIYLPTAEGEVAVESTKPETEEVAGGRETILLVDDETEILQIASTWLKEAGYSVVTATSGEEAISIINRSQDIQLVLTDVIMPGGMNGFELAMNTVRSWPLLKVCLTSGYTGKAGDALVGGNLIINYLSSKLLSKPYSRINLLHHVRYFLDQKHVYEWSAKLTTGVQELDEDHRVLFALTNCLDSFDGTGKTGDRIKAVYSDLARYALQHFRREEAVMKACNYPNTDEHIKSHRKFKQWAGKLPEKLNDSAEPDMLDETNKYLKTWLVHHIEEMDSDIERYTHEMMPEVERALEKVRRELEELV